MQLFSDVLENYLTTNQQLGGLATNNGTVDQLSLRIGLPEFFLKLLSEKGRHDEFKVVGSIGNGYMAKVPWVGVFNKLVTETAQEGYYIVLLFSEDMSSCYLSLNQGVTGLRAQYGQEHANTKMRAASKLALQFLPSSTNAKLGRIDLNATAHLGRGYEIGSIESFRYDRLQLPDDSAIADDFFYLLAHYDRLVSVLGPSLQAFLPVSEEEYHQLAMDKALNVNLDDDEPDDAKPIPPRSTTSKTGYLRNVKFAALALARAGFRCEINSNHETFLLRAGNRYYIEAHHLVPISKQDAFAVSLDVPANIVALCATCHKLLHHGRMSDKRRHLLRLLDVRQARLLKTKIILNEKDLLSYYGRDMLEDN